MFGGFTSSLKDRAVVAAARSHLQKHIEGFGEVTRLELDSRARTIEAEIALKGEHAPVSIRIGRYEVRRRGDEAFIVVENVSASRQWISAAVEKHITGREFKLPPIAATALS